MNWVRAHHDETGQTLTDELVALAILAMLVSIVLLSISTGIAGVKTKDQRVAGETLARSQLELILDASYSADPTAIPYPTVAPITGYTVDTTIEYWNAASESFSSVVQNDDMQKITVSVSGTEGQILQLECYKVER